MGIPYSQRTNCAIVSFEDTLTVNFASCIIEADVERRFFQKLVEEDVYKRQLYCFSIFKTSITFSESCMRASSSVRRFKIRSAASSPGIR